MRRPAKAGTTNGRTLCRLQAEQLENAGSRLRQEASAGRALRSANHGTRRKCLACTHLHALHTPWPHRQLSDKYVRPTHRRAARNAVAVGICVREMGKCPPFVESSRGA